MKAFYLFVLLSSCTCHQDAESDLPDIATSYDSFLGRIIRPDEPEKANPIPYDESVKSCEHCPNICPNPSPRNASSKKWK